MRDFLTNIKIVGAALVSQEEGEILDIFIANMMKWCDWIFLMMDSVEEATEKKVWEYQKKYPDRIRVAYTGLEMLRTKGYFKRFKLLHGRLRESVFVHLRNFVRQGDKIDILLFPDSDEIFSNSLPRLLENFWAMPNKRAITLKTVHVFNDMKAILGRSGANHVRILKFASDFTGIPYRNGARYIPLTNEDTYGVGWGYLLIHLSMLTAKNRAKRRKNWKFGLMEDRPLWVLDKDVREMAPSEIKHARREESKTTVGEYLKSKGKTLL